ncbi:unnamed protein product [Effrenium voratum]|nr:unnamed protein product [Effrenium voratum]
MSVRDLLVVKLDVVYQVPLPQQPTNHRVNDSCDGIVVARADLPLWTGLTSPTMLLIPPVEALQAEVQLLRSCPKVKAEEHGTSRARLLRSASLPCGDAEAAGRLASKLSPSRRQPSEKSVRIVDEPFEAHQSSPSSPRGAGAFTTEEAPSEVKAETAVEAPVYDRPHAEPFRQSSSSVKEVPKLSLPIPETRSFQSPDAKWGSSQGLGEKESPSRLGTWPAPVLVASASASACHTPSSCSPRYASSPPKVQRQVFLDATTGWPLSASAPPAASPVGYPFARSLGSLPSRSPMSSSPERDWYRLSGSPSQASLTPRSALHLGSPSALPRAPFGESPSALPRAPFGESHLLSPHYRAEARLLSPPRAPQLRLSFEQQSLAFPSPQVVPAEPITQVDETFRSPAPCLRADVPAMPRSLWPEGYR